MTISGIIYPKCLKNEKNIKITKVGLEAEAAELEDAEAVEVESLKDEVADTEDTEAVSEATNDEKQYIAIGR